MRDKTSSLLSKHLNKEKTTHRNIHSTYSIMSWPNPSYYSLGLLSFSQWKLMEYNGVSTTRVFYCVLQAMLQQQLISCEGKNTTLRNQKRGTRVHGISVNVQLTTALNMKSECITDKHIHKYQMIIIYRQIAWLLPPIHTFFPNHWMNFSVLRPYFTKTFKTHFHISLCL